MKKIENTNKTQNANNDDIRIVNHKTGEHVLPKGRSVFRTFEEISKNDCNYSLFIPADIIEPTR